LRKRLWIIYASLIGSVLTALPGFAASNTSVFVAVASPASGTVEIVGSAKGGNIVRVDILVDGANAKSCNARRCVASWNTLAISNGEHRVKARAILGDGRVVSSERLVLVANGMTVPAPTADIVPSALALGSATVGSGLTTSLQLTVSNLGTATADSIAVTISLSASGTISQAARITVGALSAGASGAVSTMLSAPTLPGTYSVVATVATSTPESSTQNNTIATPLQVLTSPSTSSDSTTPAGSAGAVYYLSPNGNDTYSGGYAAPWKTFAFAVRRLVPGDTLVLLDGKYDAATTGLPFIDCMTSAQNGTASNPITVRAQNERRALLSANGTQAALKIQDCSYWTFVGLYTRQVDNVSSNGWQGHNVWVLRSHHVALQRFVTYGNNRYWNTHAVEYEKSNYGLVEECEVYFFHRHGISFGAGSSYNIARRNYLDSRNAGDVCSGCNGDSSLQSSAQGDEGITIAYPGSNNIAENNIAVNNYIGYAINALGTTIGNAAYGNVSLNNLYGFGIFARGSGLSNTPRDTILEHNVVLGGTAVGVYSRASKNTQIRNLTTLGSSNNSGLVADISASRPGDGISTVYVVNSLSQRNKQYGFNMVTTQLTDWLLDYSNGFGNAINYSPATSSNITNTQSTDALLGSCTVWIPDRSTMKKAGRGGADIGANLLYRYENGRLTTEPLWDIGSGEFPHGVIVPGVNDIAGQSAFDIHRRLNVNTNDCAFPTGYTR
jgi:hypothetical protein